jgi:hypothetical protein
MLSDERSVYITSVLKASTFFGSGLLGNFIEQGMNCAPEYTKYATDVFSINSMNSMYLMPTGKRTVPANPAVLIDNDIYHEYGKKIASIKEYEELIYWLMDRYPHDVPGLYAAIPSDKEFGERFGYSIFNFFLPEMGYSSLADIFLHDAGVGNYLWIENDSKVINTFFNIPAAEKALLRLLDWKNNNLLDFWDGKKTINHKYATILVNSVELRISGVDTTGYTINLFTEHNINYPVTDSVSIALTGTDLTEFLLFMEWLEDIDNYIYFTFGINGVDYVESDGLITEFISDYICWEGTPLFMKDDFDSELLNTSLFVPMGYTEEVYNLNRPYYHIDPILLFDIGVTLANDATYTKAMNSVHYSMTMLLETLYLSESNSDPSEIINNVFENMRRQNGIDLALSLMKGIKE